MANIIEILLRAKDDASGKIKTVKSELGGLDKAVGGLRVGLGSLGLAFGVVEIASFVKNSLAAADAVGDAAERAGVLTSELSRMKYAAEQSGVSFESLSGGVKLFQRTLANAFDGSKEAISAFEGIGLSANELRGKNLDQQLGKIADAFNNIIDPAERTKAAMEIFGRSGADLIPLLNRGSAGINELSAKADELGITLDDRATKAINRSTKALDSFWESLKSGTSNTIGGALAAMRGTGDEFEDLSYRLEKAKERRDKQVEGAGSGFFTSKDTSFIDRYISDLESSLAPLTKAREESERKRDADRSALEYAKDNNTAVGVHLYLLSQELEKAAKIKDEFDEVRTTLKKIGEGNNFEKMLDEWEKDTQTTTDKIIEDYNAVLEKIHQLQKAGRKTPAQADEARSIAAQDRDKALDDAFPEIDIEAIKAKHVEVAKITTETTDIMRGAWEQVGRSIQSTLSDAIYNGELSMRSLVDVVRRALADLASAILISGIKEAFADQFSGGGSGSKGNGIISGILGAIAGAFGGGSAAPAPGANFSGPRAAGGRTDGLAWVGEEGPELVNVGKGAQIYNARHLAFASGSGGGGVNFAPTTVFNVQGGSTSEETERRMMEYVNYTNQKQQAELERKLERNGYGVR